MKELDNKKQAIGDFVHNGLTIFGIDVNTKRQLPSVYDGLKPAYRHIIYEELKSGFQMRKSVAIAGSCINTTHGHGDASLKDPISNLVRWGISKGQGNHGKRLLYGDNAEPSSMRYTEARISDKYYNILNEYMPFVPYIQSEIEGTEPEYLPTIVPICLTHGTQGIGIGVNCRIPAFTVDSMIKALLADDPNLLEAPFGMVIDKDKSELDALWRTGVGKVCYKFVVEGADIGGSWGYLIKGVPELFKPNMYMLEKLKSANKVFINDLTDKTGSKVFIAREYNVKSVTHDEIKELCIKAATNTKTYRLTVADRDKVYLIPLKDWLQRTYDNYLKIIEDYKQHHIKKLEFDYQVYEHLPGVVNCLYNNRDYDAGQISNITKVDLEVVKAIMSKSISTLRRADSTSKLQKISEEILRFSNIDPVERAKLIINEF